jgi:hypothetical protein
VPALVKQSSAVFEGDDWKRLEITGTPREIKSANSLYAGIQDFP